MKNPAQNTLHGIFAEAEGFEPPVRCRTTVFKTAAIDHSATPPKGPQRYKILREETNYSSFEKNFHWNRIR